MPDDTLPREGNTDAPDVLTSRKASTEEPYREHEADTVEWVEGLYDDAKKARQDQCDPDTWEEDADVYWGDQWPEKMPLYKPRIVVNEIKSLLLQELSDLTDARLKVFVQKDRTTMAQDEAVEFVIQTFWKEQFSDMAVMNAALDGMISPLGFLETGWDPYAEQGQGEIRFRARDPFSVFPDGDAEDDDTMAYWVTRDVVDLIQLRRDFPETGMLVEPEAPYSEPMSPERRERPSPRAGSGYTGPLYSQTPGGSIQLWRKARAQLLRCVVEDDTRMEELEDIVGPSGAPEVRAVHRPKYPHKRMLIVANRRVLYDEDCPYHHAPILVSVAMQPRVHAYWPRASIVRDYASIQVTANKMDSMVAENGLRLNLGQTFADANSGIDPLTYGNIPGVTHLINPNSREPKVVYPPAMPPDMVQAGERFRAMIRENFGYPVRRTGAGQAGNISSDLADTEISQSMGLTRLRGRLLHQAVQRSVSMIFARMAQFYTTPRHFPYIEGSRLKSVRWEPIARPEDYVVRVDPAMFEIRAKTMQQRLALALARLGKYPTKDLLMDLGIPDAEKKAETINAEMAIAAMAKIRGKKA